MKRVKLVIAYDGTNYCGWQTQPNGMTIEELLNRHLSALLKEEIQVIGASRTDSGVHALGNVAVFDTETRIPAEKIALALNQRLPGDIVVQGSCQVADDFHPRKCNSRKTYEYRILNRRIPLPAERFNSLFYYMPLDLEKMRQAAAYLLGEHDFVSFCSPRNQLEDTVRTIYSLTLEKQEDMIVLRICGNGFLYNMVRIIVGTLLRVGTGYYTPEHVEEILDARDRSLAGPKAPAHGLTLVSIEQELKPEPVIHETNKWMEYCLIQETIASQGCAFLVLMRCAKQDTQRTIIRLCKKATRNGAEKVYVQDWTGTISDGCRLGYFTFIAIQSESVEKTWEHCGAKETQKEIFQSGFTFGEEKAWFETQDFLRVNDNEDNEEEV